MENLVPYHNTVMAQQEQLQEQFAVLMLRLSKQEALINCMKDQVRFFLVAFIGKPLTDMDVLKRHVGYSQNRTIMAENKATEAWAHLRSYIKSNNEVGRACLSFDEKHAGVICRTWRPGGR